MDTPSPVLARFASPTAAVPTRLAIFSDLHLSTDDEGSWRVSHRTEQRLQRAVEDVNTRPVDAVVFNGDLVNGGTRAQFEAFDRVIAELEHPFFAVPGNHDLIDWNGDDPFTLPEFERRYTPGELPFHERIGGVDVLALNSNRSTAGTVADDYAGRLEPESLAWLARKLEAVEHPLVVVHHTLPGTRTVFEETVEELPVSGGSPGFDTADEMLSTLIEGAAPLVLTGHLHFPGIVDIEGVREFTLPSLGPYPGAYTELEITEDGTVARLHPVTGFDDRIEAFVYGIEHTRVQIAAAQLAGLPLLDDFSDDVR